MTEGTLPLTSGKAWSQQMEIGDEFYTLTDEDGNEYVFEMIGHCELNNNVYYAFAPVNENDEDEREYDEYTILKEVINEAGETEWVSIDDDDEFDAVADYFDDFFSQEIDYDAGEDEN